MISIGETSAQLKPAEIATPAEAVSLLFYSYNQSFQPWVTWSREIRRELDRQSPWPLDIRNTLFSTLSGDDAADGKFVEYLTALYGHGEPDLIIALGGPAARFVQQHRLSPCFRRRRCCSRQLKCAVFPSPCCEEDAFVGTQVDHGAIVGNILRLLPETIAIIMSSPPSDFGSARCSANLRTCSEERLNCSSSMSGRSKGILKEVAGCRLTRNLFPADDG